MGAYKGFVHVYTVSGWSLLNTHEIYMKFHITGLWIKKIEGQGNDVLQKSQQIYAGTSTVISDMSAPQTCLGKKFTYISQ